MTSLLKVERLDRRVRIEQPVADLAYDGAGSGTWETVAETWAEIQDDLPSRGERQSGGFTTLTRPARVRMRYRTDLSAEMRLAVLRRVNGEWVVERLLQLVSAPAELGRRDGLEMMTEEYSSAGNLA